MGKLASNICLDTPDLRGLEVPACDQSEESANPLRFLTLCLDEIVLAEPTKAFTAHATRTANVFLTQVESLTRNGPQRFDLQVRAGQLVAACCERLQRMTTTAEVKAAKKVNVKELWVQQCLSSGSLKWAVQAVTKWGMQAQFASLEHRWLESNFSSALDRADWGHAALLAIEDPKMKAVTIKRLIDAKEMSLAMDFCFQFSGQEGKMLPLLLQIATQDQVFIFDLLALHGHTSKAVTRDASTAKVRAAGITLEQLDACLAPVLMSAPRYKLSCGLDGRLKELSKALPKVKAFQCIQDRVDVRDLWTKHASQAAGQT
ncbi:hypothetical protein WJX73_000019 [Symbiochloris irregularis]|uniref:Uncharacterized protein n=1 Tax=Symbiochloris irregularis TaxID=706552 RepID=A0AAW1P6A7_9CHLO